MTLFPFRKFLLPGLAVGLHILSGAAFGQAAGEFVIPSIRTQPGYRFAYWDQFSQTNANGYNYQLNNPPALAGGADALGNPTTYGIGATASRLAYVQTGTATAFVTGTGAIYSFSQPTAFTMTYQPQSGDGSVSNVIFQTQTGGTRLDLNNITLEFVPLGGGPLVTLQPQFKALDDPQTGAFSERLVAAFQWNLSSYQVGQFVIRFAAPNSSMPIWQSQFDVGVGVPFTQSLGYLLQRSSLPSVRFGSPGRIELNVAEGAETRFFLPGTILNLTGEPSAGFSHVGWKRGAIISEGSTYALTFGAADEAITAIFCPLNYATWRNHFFNHANTLTQTGPDHLTESVSGKTADPDGDGCTNLQEFAFGGNPYVADAAVMQGTAGSIEINGQRYQTLTYLRRAATDLDLEILYEVQRSVNLQTWESNEDTNLQTTAEISSTLLSNGMRSVTVRSLTPWSAGAQEFLRVKATEL
jgi:hypothetical protein